MKTITAMLPESASNPDRRPHRADRRLEPLPPSAQRRAPAVRYQAQGVTSRLGVIRNAAVLNISLSGFAVETHKYLRLGESYPVRLTGSTQLDLTAEVVWCRMICTIRNHKGEIEPLYHAGFTFLNMTTACQWKLRAFIRQDSSDPGCSIAS